MDWKSHNENQDIQHNVCPRSPILENEVPPCHLGGHKYLRDRVKHNVAVFHSLKFVQPVFYFIFILIHVFEVNLQSLKSKNYDMQQDNVAKD